MPYLDFLSHPLFIYIMILVLSVIHLSRQTFTLMQTRIKPSLLFLLSFIIVILVGAGLLMLPNATTRPIHFVDALFTATTSVCVTGLTTVDVATTFTHIGQIIIMILIQIGGIGVMTFTSFFALSFMGHSSFTSKMVLKDMLNEERISGLFRVLLNILFVTFFIEGVGAYFIYMDIRGTLPGSTLHDDLFFAVFHAISAFCNAGISTLSGNMCDPLVAHNYNLHIWISLLIVFGGLGFPIVFNYLKLLRHFIVNTFMVATRLQKRYIHTPRIINIHTYIVVISTLILIGGGMFFYYLFEMNNTLAGLPLKGKLADVLLGAVTPRTAGFAVADMGALRPVTLMLTLILMVIGAAPMSTGGGLKVTTVFVAFLTAFNVAREKEKVEVRKREISLSTIRRAFATIVLYFLFASLAVWILSYTEEGTHTGLYADIRGSLRTEHSRVEPQLHPASDHSW
ncbi:MAG: potassium transporter [Parabacteroides sp.]|nr:potassium transporter [Parabacteroides sp.]